MGGGTAALLTYILREHKEFSSTTCVAFAPGMSTAILSSMHNILNWDLLTDDFLLPASCMTWELAESGKHFVTTVVNGADLVPTVSTASIDDLRSEVATFLHADLLL